MQHEQSGYSVVANAAASVIQLIDPERVLEVIDLICEDEPAAFGRWIGYLEADLAKFPTLLPATGTTESNRQIQGLAHSLKGTCMNLGAAALATLFAELERHAKAGESEAINQRYAQDQHFEIGSTQALRKFAAELSATRG